MKKCLFLYLLMISCFFSSGQDRLKYYSIDSLSDDEFFKLYPYQYLSSKKKTIEGISLAQMYSDVHFIIRNYSKIKREDEMEDVMVIRDLLGLKKIGIGMYRIDSINDINFYQINDLSGQHLGCLYYQIGCIAARELRDNYLIGIYLKKDRFGGVRVINASANLLHANVSLLLDNLRKNDTINEKDVLKMVKNYYGFLEFKTLSLVKKSNYKYLYHGIVGDRFEKSTSTYCSVKVDFNKKSISITAYDKESWLYYAIKKYNL